MQGNVFSENQLHKLPIAITFGVVAVNGYQAQWKLGYKLLPAAISKNIMVSSLRPVVLWRPSAMCYLIISFAN